MYFNQTNETNVCNIFLEHSARASFALSYLNLASYVLLSKVLEIWQNGCHNVSFLSFFILSQNRNYSTALKYQILPSLFQMISFFFYFKNLGHKNLNVFWMCNNSVA